MKEKYNTPQLLFKERINKDYIVLDNMKYVTEMKEYTFTYKPPDIIQTIPHSIQIIRTINNAPILKCVIEIIKIIYDIYEKI